jgi:Raf kinase inhibitor-like YbhB/YbcL family protein
MAPVNAKESAIADLVRKRYDSVSAERLLPGPELLNSCNALCRLSEAPGAVFRPAISQRGHLFAAIDPHQFLRRGRGAIFKVAASGFTSPGAPAFLRYRIFGRKTKFQCGQVFRESALGRRNMRLNSSAFSDGSAIPRRYTCDGEDRSPPFDWSGVPAGTRSLVLLCDDPDAPGGTWHHWAAYDIPADRRAVAEGAGKYTEWQGFKQAINDFRRFGYGGPCPPRGHGPHHYHFRLLALSIDRLMVRKGPPCRDVEREARKHILAEAILVGVYER